MSDHRRTDICYLVSHGFSARMIFQTGLMRMLTERGRSVAVIAPDAEDANLRVFCREQNVQLVGWKPARSFFNIDFQFKRKYYLEDIRNNPALWAKHLNVVRGPKSRNPYFWVAPYVYYGIYKLIRRFPGIRERFRRREAARLRSEEAKNILRQLNPELVVATYPVDLQEAMLLRAAQTLGIPTSIHLLSWDNITCKGYFPATADYYIAWGPIMREELQQYYGVETDRIYECGVPHFDEHVRTRRNPGQGDELRKLGLDSKHPYLFVAMSSPVFFPRGMEVIEWLAAEVERGEFGPDMQLVVRPHPQNVQGGMADTSWLPRLDALGSERVAIDYPDLAKSKLPWSMQQADMSRLSRLLARCAVSVNFASTVSIDALMVGKSVIVVAFDGKEELPWHQSGRRTKEYPHFAKLIATGGVRVASDFASFRAHLHHYLSDPDADLEARNFARERECGPDDGKATERVAEALLAILQRTKQTLAETNNHA